MAASDDAVRNEARWTLVDEEGNVQGSDSDIGSVSSSDCVAVEEDAVSYHAKRSRSSTGNSVSGSPPRNQIDQSTDNTQNVPTSSSSWLGGFWTKNTSPASANSRLNETEENKPLPSVPQEEKDTHDTESLESIEVLSMPSDGHSDIDIHPNNEDVETLGTFDPLGAVGSDWNRRGDAVKPMCATNVVTPMEGLSPTPCVEDLTSSSNSSQLDFLIVDHQGPKNGAIEEEEAASKENPRGAMGGNSIDEEERMERSVGTAEPLPTMPPGQLPLSSVSVDNIPRGVEAGGSPRRAQSEGCITQQLEEVSGVGVPIMTQRWPTEDGGFLLVQQFRGDGEPAMSRSSSFSDLSSSFSYPGVRRRIPTNSTSSLQRQGTEGSETSSSEASHYNSDSSNDALPANMTVSGIKPGIRQYLHQRDESLNSKLTLAALIVVTAAVALVLGHYIGSMQATSHHLGIEAGQVWRLRSLQDQLVTCLDKTKTLLRGAKGSTGTSQPKATSPLDPQSSAELPVPSVYMMQESDSDDPFSCSVCENGEQPLNRYSKLCNTQCKPNKDGKDLQESLSKGNDVSDHVLKLSHIDESFPDIDMTSKCMPDVHTTCPQIQGEPEAQGEDTVIDVPNGDAGNTDPAMDVIPLSEAAPVDNDGLDDGLIAEGSVLEQDHAAEAEESEGGAESDQKKQGDTEINQVGAPAYEGDSSSSEKHDVPDEVRLNTEDVVMNDSQEQGEDETLDQVEEILDPVEEEFLDQVVEEFLDQAEDFLDPVEEEFLDQVEEEFLDQVEEEFVDQVEAEFQDQVEVESQARGEEEPQDQGGEEFLDKEVEFSDSSSPSPEGDNVDSQEETTDSPNDEDFMGKLSAKLSDSWFILRNFTTDLVGSAANLSVNNVTTQLKENVETLRHQIKDAVSNLQKSNITTHLKDNVNSLGEHLKDAVSTIKEGNFSRTVKDTMQDLGGKVRNAVTGIKESNITSQIKESLHGLGEKIQGAVSSVKESGRQLKKPFKNTVKAVKNLIKGKPINSGKETDEEKLEQEDFVQPKEPSANKKKGKSNRKSPGQVAKLRLKRKERAKNKRKEDIKKINTNKNAAKQKNDMKTNRKKNNHNKDQSKNQHTVMKEKSHSHDTHVKTERHGKSKSHKKNEKKHQPNQVNKHNRKDGEEKRMKRKDKEILHDNKDSKKHRSEKLNGNDQDSKHIQEHLSYRSVPSRKIHGDNMDTERKSEVERKSDMKFQPDDAKIREEPPTSKERKYHKGDHSQKGKQLYEQRHKDKRKHESEESSYHHNHQSKHTHHQESNNHRGHRHNGKKHANHHHDKAHDTRHRFGDKMWEESTHHRHYQGKHNHHQEKNDYFGHGHEDKHGKENQDKEGDTKFRFEDIKWEDIFDSFDVRCFGVRDCLRKQREAAVKLYEELLDYQDWLTKRCYKKHLDELKDFMEELEEFLAEPFLTDADLEELMEDFEDMAEDIEEATTKNFWKFMKMRTPRQKGGEDSESRDHSKRGSNKKKQREDKEKTLTVTLDLKQALNSSETVDVSESDDYRRHAGYGYQSNDDWFIRRMQDREKSRNKEDQYESLEEHPNEANGNWYDHWMQGREDGRTGMTVWDLYQWFSKRQALRHEWRLHEMDDQSNWFLRRP